MVGEKFNIYLKLEILQELDYHYIVRPKDSLNGKQVFPDISVRKGDIERLKIQGASIDGVLELDAIRKGMLK